MRHASSSGKNVRIGFVRTDNARELKLLRKQLSGACGFVRTEKAGELKRRQRKQGGTPGLVRSGDARW